MTYGAYGPKKTKMTRDTGNSRTERGNIAGLYHFLKTKKNIEKYIKSKKNLIDDVAVVGRKWMGLAEDMKA